MNYILINLIRCYVIVQTCRYALGDHRASNKNHPVSTGCEDFLGSALQGYSRTIVNCCIDVIKQQTLIDCGHTVDGIECVSESTL